MIAKLHKIYLAFGIVSAFFLLSECKQDNRLNIELEANQPELVWNRLDSSMFSSNEPSIEAINTWRSGSAGFFPIYLNRILKLPVTNDTVLSQSIKDFVTDADLVAIHRDTKQTFAHLSSTQALLNEGFAHYHHYFPNKKIPIITTFISGFNLTIASTDSVLGIGLDMYLGKDYKFYHELSFPNYKTARMQAAYIPYDAMKGWGQTEFEPKEELQDFLSNMVFNGKVLYFLDAMFPNGADSLKIGYTQTQLEFCKKNEPKIWAAFIEQKVLFSSVYREYSKYLSDGPTTNGFPRETPGMIGTFIGWQIVRKYMNENPSVTLPQLMQEMDANKILTKSKYKPV